MYIRIGEFVFHNGKEVFCCKNQFWKRVMKIKLVYQILWCEHLNETPSAQMWHVFVLFGTSQRNDSVKRIVGLLQTNRIKTNLQLRHENNLHKYSYTLNDIIFIMVVFNQSLVWNARAIHYISDNERVFSFYSF